MAPGAPPHPGSGPGRGGLLHCSLARSFTTWVRAVSGLIKPMAGRVLSRHRRLSRRRMRDALGYRPWTPPAPATRPVSEASVPAPGVRMDTGARLAQAALRLRQSSAGPLLRALTPGFVREALKARLK